MRLNIRKNSINYYFIFLNLIAEIRYLRYNRKLI